VSVSDSQFSGLQSLQGGAVYLSQGPNAKADSLSSFSYSLSNNVFVGNWATYEGGAVYLMGPQHLIMEGNVFRDNWAGQDIGGVQEAYGGAVYYSCAGLQKDCGVAMLGNTFVDNRSRRSGGAVQWTDLEPVYIIDETNVFTNNTATIYGNDIASFPQMIIQLDFESRRLLQETSATLDSQRSGS